MQFICNNCIFNEKICKNLLSPSYLKSYFKSWSIVFFGSDYYSLGSLKELHKLMENKLVRNLEVVTKNVNSPVYKFAASKHIKSHVWPPVLSDDHDFGVLVSFGKFIPKKMLDQFPLGIINVHPSLLPRWRGGMPIVHTIKNGDTTTGVTIIRINSDEFDAGEIILQRSCSVGKNELLPSLYNRLNKLGSKCLVEVIYSMPECLKNCRPQSNINASKAPILRDEKLFVKWDEMTAMEVYNLYRALFSLCKLKTRFNGKEVELLCMSVNESDECLSMKFGGEALVPGSVQYDKKNKCLMVQCKDRPVRLCTVIINGKLYSARNYFRGFLNKTFLKPESSKNLVS